METEEINWGKVARFMTVAEAPAYTAVYTGLKDAWVSAVLAYNGAEAAGLTDTAAAIAEIVVKLSQQLQFCEVMIGDSVQP